MTPPSLAQLLARGYFELPPSWGGSSHDDRSARAATTPGPGTNAASRNYSAPTATRSSGLSPRSNSGNISPRRALSYSTAAGDTDSHSVWELFDRESARRPRSLRAEHANESRSPTSLVADLTRRLEAAQAKVSAQAQREVVLRAENARLSQQLDEERSRPSRLSPSRAALLSPASGMGKPAASGRASPRGAPSSTSSPTASPNRARAGGSPGRASPGKESSSPGLVSRRSPTPTLIILIIIIIPTLSRERALATRAAHAVQHIKRARCL